MWVRLDEGLKILNITRKSGILDDGIKPLNLYNGHNHYNSVDRYDG